MPDLTYEDIGRQLVQLAGACSKDPLRFVRVAFPWGKDSLADWKGPDKWQEQVLTDIRDRLAREERMDGVLNEAVAAGHGVGKSALVAWLTLWALCTFPDTRGVITANTEAQLRTKTFAEISKWWGLCLFREWFTCSAMSIASRQPGHEKTWRIDAIPWSESRPEGFAGLHNADKRILVIFDEASAIVDPIWEVTEGALTDRKTQIFWCVFGNPTRSTGRFYECFNRFRKVWIHRHVDGRDAIGTNKKKIAEWARDYGEDSDFFKVRVKGEFPSASDLQFIARDIAEKAAHDSLPHVDYTRQVAILGLDVALFGDDSSVLFTRFGIDARSFGFKRYRGLDGWQLGAKVAEHYNELRKLGVGKIIINVDGGGVGAAPVAWLRANGYPVNSINFGLGATAADRYANLRAEMWGRMRDWLKEGGCIPDDDDLITDLTGVEYDYTPKNQILLEKKKDMKKRGLASPDTADALALTFAIKCNEYLDDIPSPQPRSRFEARRTRDPYRR